MSTNNFYPSLSTLVQANSIPDNFGFLENGITTLFDHFYYRDLQIHKSVGGDVAFYSINLLTYKRLAIDIPGTGGLALVLNPSFIEGSSSEFPVSLGYKLAILKFVKGFDIANFDFSPQAFYDLLIEISGANNGDLLSEAIFIFIDDTDPIQKFIDDFNTNNSPVTPLVKSSDPDDSVVIADLVTQLSSNGNDFDAVEVILTDVLSIDGVDAIPDKLEVLFAKFLGGFSLKNIEQLFIPQVSAALNNIDVALEFPRSVFQPLLPNGTINPDENIKTQLKFNVGSLNYSTENGLVFENESSFNFNRSAILNTGFYLDLEEMKLDLSRTKNIPEAIADGRPDDFVGVYIKDGTVGFPAFWNHDANASTGELKVSNLLAGTGGLSGTIALAAKDGINPAPLIKAKFGNFEVSLNAFSLTFQQNSIIASDIAGTMKIAGFKDALGNDAEIGIRIHIGANGEFSVVAQESQGILLKIPNVLEFNVVELAIGKQDGHYFVGVSGNLGFIAGGVASKLARTRFKQKRRYRA
jgi:hypothetical protein